MTPSEFKITWLIVNIFWGILVARPSLIIIENLNYDIINYETIIQLYIYFVTQLAL